MLSHISGWIGALFWESAMVGNCTKGISAHRERQGHSAPASSRQRAGGHAAR